FFQAEDGIRDLYVTGVQTCALPISDALSSFHLDRDRTADEVDAAVPEQKVRSLRMKTRQSIGVCHQRIVGNVLSTMSQDEGGGRSEERRVGKEGRSRGATCDEKEEI